MRANEKARSDYQKARLVGVLRRFLSLQYDGFNFC